jgi:hypothetical protein
MATLAFIIGSLFSTVNLRCNTAHQSSSWSEASIAAEAAADMAVAELRRVVPEITALPSDRWHGWTSSTGSLPAGKGLDPGMTLSLAPSPLVHQGEGNTVQRGNVTVALLESSPGGAAQQWFRVRATGMTSVPGPARAGDSRLDVELRRLSLVMDPTTGERAAQPTASRTVEVVVRPVLPFETALVTQGRLEILSAAALVDSFDSRSPLKSTSGEYDAAKRQAHGGVFTNDSDFTLEGEVLGDVGTNGGTVAVSPAISGTVDNTSYRPLPPIPAPTWSSTASSSTISGETPDDDLIIVESGSVGAPPRYKFTDVRGTLHVSGGWSQETAAEIWVTGNVDGAIVIESRVHATFYVSGNVTLRSNGVDNWSRRACNLQIYGIQPPAGETRNIHLTLGDDIHASVYAPGHDIEFYGGGNVMGAIIGKSLRATGQFHLHFDEALMLTAGKVVDYRMASWIEDVR